MVTFSGGHNQSYNEKTLSGNTVVFLSSTVTMLGLQSDHIWSERHPEIEDTAVREFLLGLEWVNLLLV